MRSTSLAAAALAVVLLLSCAGRTPQPAPAAANATAPAALAEPAPEAAAPAPAEQAEPAPPLAMQESDITEPEPPAARKKSQAKDPGSQAKDAKAAKAKEAAAAKARAEAPALGPEKAPAQCYAYTPQTRRGRCEPQCIPYARCRTGVMSCRLGPENNSLTWFACEQKHKNTTPDPAPGMVMILKANVRRNMPTGHALVVEQVAPHGDEAFFLVVSHANYDRECSLETGAQVLYNRATLRAAFLDGEWKAWATDLAVAGFIKN